MPFRAGGGGAGAPQAPISPQPGSPGIAAVADAATGQIVLELPAPSQKDLQNYLLEAVVRVDLDIEDQTIAKSGPGGVRLYLKRSDTTAMLLDSGFVETGFSRGDEAVVGVVCHIAFAPGDKLIANLWNDSGATVNFRLNYKFHEHDPHGVPEALHRLSSKGKALWLFRVTLLENTAAGGNHTLTIQPAAGDDFDFIGGQVVNGDAAARNVFAQVQDGSGNFVWDLTNTDNAALSVAATSGSLNALLGVRNIPSVAPTAPFVTPIRNPMLVSYELDLVAQTKTTGFLAWGWVTGRKPVTTAATSGATGATITKVLDKTI